MIKKTELRDLAYEYILRMPSGRIFGHAEIYKYLETNFPGKCQERGDAKLEPRYQNDARWAVFDAKSNGYADWASKDRGTYRRMSKRN